MHIRAWLTQKFSGWDDRDSASLAALGICCAPVAGAGFGQYLLLPVMIAVFAYLLGRTNGRLIQSIQDSRQLSDLRDHLRHISMLYAHLVAQAHVEGGGVPTSNGIAVPEPSDQDIRI